MLLIRFKERQMSYFMTEKAGKTVKRYFRGKSRRDFKRRDT